MRIAVSDGKAWVGKRWVENDSDYELVLDPGAAVGNRYDAIALIVDLSRTVRSASISVYKGTPSTIPVRPTPGMAPGKHWIVLGYVYVAQGATSVDQTNIEQMVGKHLAPYVTSPVSNLTTTQWDAEFRTWFDNMKTILAGSPVEKLTKLSTDVSGLTAQMSGIPGQLNTLQNEQNATKNRLDTVSRSVANSESLVNVLSSRITTIDDDVRKLKAGGGVAQVGARSWRLGFAHDMRYADASTLIHYTGDATHYTPASKSGPGSWENWDWINKVRLFWVGKDGRGGR